jgi:GntR family transcriptional repressor for pyruvate dehydrogenase complex
MSIIEKLTPLRKQSLADEVIARLRGLILEGTLKAGDKLPAERELAERFGVGRSVVREALYKLEFFGLLQTKPQSGTVVVDLTSGGLSSFVSNVLSLAAPDTFDVVEARMLLEVSVAQLAAERADDKAIERIRSAYEQHKRMIEEDRENSIEIDLLFHIRIAEATGNMALQSLISVLAPGMVAQTKAGSALQPATSAMRAPNTCQEHEAILHAIETRDPEAAASAMRKHMMATKDYFLKMQPTS